MFSLQTEETINHSPNIKPDRWQWFWYIAIAFSLIIGIVLRVKGIGNMVVSIDEYYTIKSIRNILKCGLPAFDLGGYYKRGLLYQYLQVAVLSVTGLKPEISFRLVNVVLNLLALPAIYQLAKKVSGRTVGYLAVILFFLSLWEIEFSRYIRWMVLFQTITVWYIYFLYKVIVEENEKYFLWMFLFSFLGIFAYEQVVLLLALNFLPFVLRPKFFQISRIGISAFLFVFGYSFISFDFRRLGVENYLPTGVQVSSQGAHGNLLFPDLLVTTLPQNFVWLIFYLVIVFVTFYYIYTISTTGNVDLQQKISLILLLILSLLNLYALLFVSMLILLLFNWITIEDIRNKYCKQFCLLIILHLVFWFIYLSFTNSWFHFFDNLEVFSIKKALRVLFYYPNFDERIIQPFMRAIPNSMYFSFLFLSAYLIIVLFRRKRNSEMIIGFKFLVAVVLLLVTAFGVIGTLFQHTKFMFFIFPIVLISVVASMYGISKLISGNKSVSTLLFLTFIVFFITLSEDFSIYHMVNIDKDVIEYRMVYNRYTAKHYIRRRDVKTPAEYINTHKNRGDIVATIVHETDYYLNQLDYFYEPYDRPHFRGISRNEGKKELWTNANLIYTEQTFWKLLTENNATVWLIVDKNRKWFEDIYTKLVEEYRNNLVYLSLDKKIEVYKFNHNELISKPISFLPRNRYDF